MSGTIPGVILVQKKYKHTSRYIQRNMRMFTGTLFGVVKSWKQNLTIKKGMLKENTVWPHNGILYSGLKE